MILLYSLFHICFSCFKCRYYLFTLLKCVYQCMQSRILYKRVYVKIIIRYHLVQIIPSLNFVLRLQSLKMLKLVLNFNQYVSFDHSEMGDKLIVKLLNLSLINRLCFGISGQWIANLYYIISHNTKNSTSTSYKVQSNNVVPNSIFYRKNSKHK